MITVFFKIRFFRNEWLQRTGDAFLYEDCLTVQALHGDVGQGSGDRFAQDGVSAIFVTLVGCTKLDVDIRMRFFELLHSALVSDIKKMGIRIGHLDLNSLGWYRPRNRAK